MKQGAKAAIMLGDPRSRHAWRTFRLRAEYMLGALPRAARRDLLNDLEQHFAEALRQKSEGNEFENVLATLDRIGDPREFLSPLIAEAVFARATPPAGIELFVQGASQAIRRGAHEIAVFFGLCSAAVVGATLTVIGVRRFSGHAGVFLVDADKYELRLWGGSEIAGVQLLPQWAGVALVLIGAWLAWWSLRLLARQAIRLTLG